ncbi:MAG: hypothetical protein OHK0021_03860 [Bryobacter sp.]
MSRTEEGEFELVLGNRQLLSVFFIVVVLLGVFFVMGYILGKNANPTPGMDVASVRPPNGSASAAAPIEVDRTSKPSPVDVSREPESTPKPEAPKPEAPKQEPVKETPKPQPPPTPAPQAAPVRASSGGDTPVKGVTYLQVAAVGRPEGEVVAKVLRSKGYNVILAPVENSATFRVCVGPIEKSDLGKVRGELNSLGFSPFPRTF